MRSPLSQNVFLSYIIEHICCCCFTATLCYTMLLGIQNKWDMLEIINYKTKNIQLMRQLLYRKFVFIDGFINRLSSYNICAIGYSSGYIYLWKIWTKKKFSILFLNYLEQDKRFVFWFKYLQKRLVIQAILINHTCEACCFTQLVWRQLRCTGRIDDFV